VSPPRITSSTNTNTNHQTDSTAKIEANNVELTNDTATPDHFEHLLDHPDHTKSASQSSIDTFTDSSELWKTIATQQKQIDLLIGKMDDQASKLSKLEGEVMLLKAETCIKEQVSKRLQMEVSRLQQYTRRYSVSISGIEKRRFEKQEDLKKDVEDIITEVDSAVTVEDVDKFHRNGRVKDGQQEIIIRFKSHAAKEAFYKARKTLPNNRRFVKIRPSLGPHQKKLLHDANDLLANMYSLVADHWRNHPEFVMADVHGNIQIKFKEKTVKNGSLFVKFESVEEMAKIIQNELTVDESDDLHHHFSEFADIDVDWRQIHGLSNDE
jgi:hypothetical protein